MSLMASVESHLWRRLIGGDRGSAVVFGIDDRGAIDVGSVSASVEGLLWTSSHCRRLYVNCVIVVGVCV